nr:glycosyltransferase [Chloroflexaceae bacterium]
AYERRLLQRYDHVLAVSEEDRRALHRLAPQAPISIMPNGVDSEFFKNREPRTENREPVGSAAAGSSVDFVVRSTQYAVRSTQYATLVFTGTLDFRPNVDAVTWFAHQVLPLVLQRRPEARFVVVGRTPAPAVRALHNGSTFEVVPDVPDVRPYIAGAAAYLVPMRMGGGVRLKLLEALAMEAPIVSTSMGAEGVHGLTHGAQLLLADTPATFAAAVELLLAQPAFGQRLGAAGRAFVAAHYDWRAIVPRLEEVYQQLTGDQRPKTGASS